MVPIYTLIWKASSTSPLLTMWLAGYHHLSLLPKEKVVYTEHGKEKTLPLHFWDGVGYGFQRQRSGKAAKEAVTSMEKACKRPFLFPP